MLTGCNIQYCYVIFALVCRWQGGGQSDDDYESVWSFIYNAHHLSCTLVEIYLSYSQLTMLCLISDICLIKGETSHLVPLQSSEILYFAALSYSPTAVSFSPRSLVKHAPHHWPLLSSHRFSGWGSGVCWIPKRFWTIVSPYPFLERGLAPSCLLSSRSPSTDSLSTYSTRRATGPAVSPSRSALRREVRWHASHECTTYSYRQKKKAHKNARLTRDLTKIHWWHQ